MNRILMSLLLLTMFSCGKEQACSSISYENEFNASLDEDFCFDDGNSLKIIKVDDALCPCLTPCIDAGYVAFGVELNIDGEVVSGILSIDELPDSEAANALVLPNNYKIEIRDQIPASANICGGMTDLKDFSWNIVMYKGG